MRKDLFTALALAGALAIAPAAWGQQATPRGTESQPGYGQQRSEQPAAGQQQRQQATEQQRQQARDQYSQQLTTIDDLKGMDIQTAQGESLGSVDKVVIDTKEGKVAYVVVTTGGLWGIGGEQAVVPWNAFQMRQAQDQDEQVLVLSFQEEQLKNAPEADVEQGINRQQAQQIHQFYGVSPYWEEGSQSQSGQQQQMQQRQQQPQQQQQQP
ncbi:MAG: PRC-barrel domain-containing protein, partial [Desulfuromonadales bacterium]|nr:PRC-barrel domain-containing protein [Desulfuromonadales bacterium]